MHGACRVGNVSGVGSGGTCKNEPRDDALMDGRWMIVDDRRIGEEGEEGEQGEEGEE